MKPGPLSRQRRRRNGTPLQGGLHDKITSRRDDDLEDFIRALWVEQKSPRVKLLEAIFWGGVCGSLAGAALIAIVHLILLFLS